MKKRFLLLTLILCLLGGMNLSQIKAQDVQIGTIGTTESNIYPYISTHAFSTSQQIYTAAEIGQAGVISKLTFHVSDANVNKKVYDVKIYIKHTDKDAFSGKTDWDKTVTSEHLVYNGNPDITNSLLEIPISPFNYNGTQNLLVCFDVNSKQGDATYYRTYNAVSKRVMYYRNANNYGPDCDNYYKNAASSNPSNYIPVITLTFGGSAEAKTPEFTDTYAYPYNNAENVFNPYLKFYVENATHYQVTLSANEDLSSPLYQTGWEATNDEKEITIIRDFGLTYTATKYYWKVTARNGEDTDAPTAEKKYSFTTANVTTIPGAISNVSPVTGSDYDGNPKLSWDFGENTERFQLLLGTDSEELKALVDWTYLPLTKTSEQYQTNDLKSKTTYYWQVNTQNDNGTTEGEIFSFYKIGAPENVEPIEPKDGAEGVSNTATLSWRFAENTTHYRVLFDDGTGLAYKGDWKATGGAQTATFETETLGLKAGKTYRWAIDVKNNSGERTYYGNGETPSVFSYTTASLLPAICSTPAEGQVLTENTVTLAWTYQGTPSHYKVLLGTDGRNIEEATDWMEVSGETSDSFTTEITANNTKYYWQVIVKDKSENEEYSEVRTFISLLDDPTFKEESINVYPGSNTAATQRIQWNYAQDATNVENYKVYVNGNLVHTTTSKNTNYYDVTNLTYNDGNANEVKVTASHLIEEKTYESQGSTINIYVSGYVNVSGRIENELNKNAISGATVIYSGTTALGDETSVTFTTDDNGNFSGLIPAGTFARNITAQNYQEVDIEESEYAYGEEYYNEVEILYPNIPEDVTDFDYTDSYAPELSWTFSEYTTHYRVLIGANENSLEYATGTEWIPTNGETTASYQTAGLAYASEYIVCIDVKNENAAPGERTWYDNTYHINPTPNTFYTSDVAPVKNNTPANEVLAGNTTVDLTWIYGDGNNVNLYQVLIGEKENDMTPTEWFTRAYDNNGLVHSGSYTATGLEANTKYYWQVNVKKGEYGDVVQGEVWSFVTTLDVPQNIAANPVEVYPTSEYLYKEGVTTVTWDAIEGASYNIYANGEQKNTEAITTNSYDLVLGYNMEENGHQITVTAIYEGLGESAKSEATSVRVTGYANVSGIVKDVDGNIIEGAAVTLEGTDEFGKEQVISFNDTDENGAYSGRIPAGKYNILIEKEPYTYYVSDLITFAQGTNNRHDVTMMADFIFTVSAISEVDKLSIYLVNEDWSEAKAATYIVSIKQGETVIETKAAWFGIINQGTKAVLNDKDFNETWFGLENGTYQIDVVRQGYDYVNTTSIERNYSIFNKDGNWNEASNWKGVPGTDTEVYIYAKATIEAENDVTVKSVTIQKGGSLTINGSLKADKVNNEFGLANLIINDGGQLRQTGNKELIGRFVMKIENPTEWSEENKDGWQFISSPFTNLKVNAFTATNDDYDFYKFDGSNQAEEWVNHKDEVNAFEEQFLQGRGYLASYSALTTFTASGIFNAETTHEFNVTPSNTENVWANFHLLGNPFAFDMDVAKFTANGLATGFAIVTEGGSYQYLTEGTIKAGDGFFAKTTEQTASLAYDDNKKVRANNSSINVIASSKAGNDNVIINFAGAEKAGFPKLKNFNEAIANIYIADEEQRYGIYNYNRDVQEIEVYFETKQMSNYTISIEPNGEFDNIILVDRFTGIETDMLLEDYTFTATSSDNDNRFIVRLSVNGQQTTDNKHFAYQSGDELIISAEGSVQIVDMLGRLVYSSDVESANNRINVSGLDKAAYIVRVVNNNEVKVQKVVIY